MPVKMRCDRWSGFGQAGDRPVVLLLYVFAAVSVLPMAGMSVTLALLVTWWTVDLARRAVQAEAFRVDSILYGAIFLWKAITRAASSSVREFFWAKGLWGRVPYLVIPFYSLGRRQVATVLHIVFVANALLVLYFLAQQHLWAPVLYKPLLFEGYRLRGYSGHPNQYAGAVSIVLLLNLSFAVFADRRMLLYTPFLLAGLVLSGSRSYLLAVVFCSVGLLGLSRSRALVLGGIGAALAAAAVFLGVVPWLPDRLLAAMSPERNARRLAFWRISWGVFLEHPILGVGAGHLQEYLRPFEQAGVIDNALQAHSLYLQELAEGGIPGFLLVVGTHIYFAAKYLRLFRRSPDPLLKSLGLGVSLAFVALLIAGAFEHTFGAAVVAMHLNFFMGVLEGYRQAVKGSGAGSG